jgi:hypothetical protein
VLQKIAFTTLFLAFTACGGPEDDAPLELDEAAVGSLSRVSLLDPHYVKASTGNLYFTTSGWREFPPGSSATVYRVGKRASPGSELQIFREETDATRQISYRDITYASVNSTWYAYWIACYDSVPATGWQCRIKRAPLAGGNAIDLVNLPANAAAIETDGSFLYWVDAAAVRRMPIGGGAMTTLTAFNSSIPTNIELDSNYLYYKSGNTVRRVPKAGGSSSIAASFTGLKNFDVYESGGRTTVYWIQSDAAVKSTVVGSNVIVTYSGPRSGRTGGTVGFDGSRVLWTDCETGSTRCLASIDVGGNVLNFNMHNTVLVAWDSTSAFYDNIGITRYDH